MNIHNPGIPLHTGCVAVYSSHIEARAATSRLANAGFTCECFPNGNGTFSVIVSRCRLVPGNVSAVCRLARFYLAGVEAGEAGKLWPNYRDAPRDNGGGR